MIEENLVTIIGADKPSRYYAHLVGVNIRVLSLTPSKRGFYKTGTGALIKATDAKIVPHVPEKKAVFEVYTLNPETGESGWDIHWVVVLGVKDKLEAKEKLKQYPNFDCVITFDHIVDMDKWDYARYNTGKNFDRIEYTKYNTGENLER